MKLSEVCDRITDGSHNPPKGVLFSEYLMLSSKNIFDDRITLTEPRYLTESEFISENARTEISQNDLLMTIVGTVGRVAIVPPNFPPVCLQRSVAVLKLDKVRVNPRYMMYQLQSMRPSFEDEAHGVAQKGLYLKQLANTTIICPPLETQKQIAATLDSVTRVIDLCSGILEKLDLLVKARFVEMFGDADEFEKWDCCTIGDVADICVGVVIKPTQYYTEKGIPAFRSLNIGEMYVKDKDWVYFTEEGHRKNQKSVIRENDVLVVRSGAPGTACVATKQYAGYNAIDIIIAHPDNSKINSIFLAAFTNMPHGMNQIRKNTGGAAQQHFNVGGYKEVRIILPPLALQEQFAAFVAQTDQTQSAVKKVLEKAETLKKALMQEYFGP